MESITNPSYLNYPDIAVLVLTCVTVIITCAALVIGAFGLFGFSLIKRRAVEKAIEGALREVAKQMEDDGKLGKLISLKMAKYQERYSGSSYIDLDQEE